MNAKDHAKLLRLSAGSLLLAQDRTVALVRESVKPHIAQAAAEARDKDQERKAATLHILLQVGAAMAISMAVAIERGRRFARSAAIRRLDAELLATGHRIHAESLMAVKFMGRAEEDAIQSRIAAESLATQWRGLAQASISMGRRGQATALQRTERMMLPRIRRTAETETAKAFNDEHAARLEDAIRSGEVDARLVMREWSALADACDKCHPLHGVRVRFDESFPGGEVPGSVHPHCACTEVVVAA